MNRQDLVYVVKKTHSIFNGLSKKNLALIAASPPGRTDTQTYVTVPLEDPDVDLVLKHEWSHVLFKTNLFALGAFADAMAEEVTAAYEVRKDDVVEAVYAVANALDDIRCNSLWAIIYPDSAERIAHRWRRLVREHPSTHLIVRIVGIGTGAVTVSNRPTVFDAAAVQALAMVQRRGYSSVLRACREMLLSYLAATARAAERQEPSVMAAPAEANTLIPPRSGGTQALSRINANRGKAKFIDTDSRPVGKDPDPESTARMVGTAMMGSSSPTEIEALLEDEGVSVRMVANQLVETRMVIDEDGKLLEGTNRVTFVDLHPKHVGRVELGDKDFDTIEALRAAFSRYLGNTHSRMTDEGVELDPQRYIDLTLGSNDLDIFKNVSRARGFYAMVLLDMSGSMVARWPMVSRACQVLADALTYPFVHLDVWGFSGGGDGQTEIYRFTDPRAGVSPRAPHQRMWGLTPIPSVLPVAMRHSEKGRGHRHVFLLSDGIPMDLSTKSSELHGAVSKARMMGQKRGVRLSTLLIGNATPPGLADALYGLRQWARVEDNQFSIFDELVDLVGRTFLTYLRRNG